MTQISDKEFYHEDFVLKIDHDKKMIHCGHVEGEALNYENLPNLLIPPSTTETEDLEISLNPNEEDDDVVHIHRSHNHRGSNQDVGPKQFGDKSSEQDDTIDSIFYELDNQFDNEYFEGPFHGNVYVRWDAAYYRDASIVPGSSPQDLEDPVPGNTLVNMDRYHQLADVVKHRISGKVGVITHITKKAIGEIVSANKLIVDFDCSKLKNIEKFFSGTTEQIVVYKSWLGKVTDIVRQVLVRFADGAKLRLSTDAFTGFQAVFNKDIPDIIFHGAYLRGDPRNFSKAKYKNFVKDTHSFNSKWLKEMAKSKSNKLSVDIVITKVILTEASVDWFMFKPRSSNSESIEKSPAKVFKGPRIKQLKSLNSRPYLYLYTGDVWYYQLQAEDKIYKMPQNLSVSKMLYKLHTNDNVKKLREFAKPPPTPSLPPNPQNSDLVAEGNVLSRKSSIKPDKTSSKTSRKESVKKSSLKRTSTDKKDKPNKTKKSSMNKKTSKASLKITSKESLTSRMSDFMNRSNSSDHLNRQVRGFFKKFQKQRNRIKTINNRYDLNFKHYQQLMKQQLNTLDHICSIYVQHNVNNVNNRHQSIDQSKPLILNYPLLDERSSKYSNKNSFELMPTPTTRLSSMVPQSSSVPQASASKSSNSPKLSPSPPAHSSNPLNPNKKSPSVIVPNTMPTVTLSLPPMSQDFSFASFSRSASPSPTPSLSPTPSQSSKKKKKKSKTPSSTSPTKKSTTPTPKKHSKQRVRTKLTRGTVIDKVYRGLQVGCWVPLQVLLAESLVDITWEDGTQATGIPSVDLIPQLFDVDDYDFFPGDFVEFKKAIGDASSGDKESKFGCVINANNLDRIATVQWFKESKKGFGHCVKLGQLDQCGSYNIRHHPDYPYHVGEFVMIQADCRKTSHPAGYISSMSPSKGMLRVKWPDMKETSLYPTEFSGIMLDIYADELLSSDNSTEDSISHQEIRDHTEVIQQLPEDYETKRAIHEIANTIISSINNLINLDLSEVNNSIAKSDKQKSEMCAIKENMIKIKQFNFSKSLNLIYDSYFALIFPPDNPETLTTPRASPSEPLSGSPSVLSGCYINIEAPSMQLNPAPPPPQLPLLDPPSIAATSSYAPLNLNTVNLQSITQRFELHTQIKSRLLNLKTSLKHWIKINAFETPRTESPSHTLQMNLFPESSQVPIVRSTNSPSSHQQLLTTSAFQQRPLILLSRDSPNQNGPSGSISQSPRETAYSLAPQLILPSLDVAQSSLNDQTAANTNTPSIIPLPPEQRGFFEIVSEGQEQNFYNKMTPPNSKSAAFLRAWNKEQSLLKTSLPRGIWVKTFESRLDLLSVMIEGPHDTPYQHGLFFFDIYLPPEYPNHPPFVHFLSNPTQPFSVHSGPSATTEASGTYVPPQPSTTTTPPTPTTHPPSAMPAAPIANIGFINTTPTNTLLPENQGNDWLNRFSISPFSLADRLNPNLYPDGRVCLSLLGTWIGRGNENWNPQYSNLLQLLVSIQGLILVSEPYFNEAGYESRRNTKDGQFNSRRFNESIITALVISSVSLLAKPLSVFEPEIKEYYQTNGQQYLSTLRMWVGLTEQAYQHMIQNDCSNDVRRESVKIVLHDSSGQRMSLGPNSSQEYVNNTPDNEVDSSQNEPTGHKNAAQSSQEQNIKTNTTQENQGVKMPKFSLAPVSKGFQLTLTKYISLLQKSLQNHL